MSINPTFQLNFFLSTEKVVHGHIIIASADESFRMKLHGLAIALLQDLDNTVLSLVLDGRKPKGYPSLGPMELSAIIIQLKC